MRHAPASTLLFALGIGLLPGLTPAQDSGFHAARVQWRKATTTQEKVAALDALRAAAASAPSPNAVVAALVTGFGDASPAVKIRAIELIAADPAPEHAASGLLAVSRAWRRQLQAVVKPLRFKKGQPVLEHVSRQRAYVKANKDRMAFVQQLGDLMQPSEATKRGLDKVKEFEQLVAAIETAKGLERARAHLLAAVIALRHDASVTALAVMLEDAGWNENGLKTVEALLGKGTKAAITIVTKHHQSFGQSRAAQVAAEKKAAKRRFGPRPKEYSEHAWESHVKKMRRQAAAFEAAHLIAMDAWGEQLGARAVTFATSRGIEATPPSKPWSHGSWRTWLNKVNQLLPEGVARHGEVACEFAARWNDS